MKNKDAEKEMNYQFIKLLLLNLQKADLLTAKESDAVQRKAQAEIKPIIGVLDEVGR